VIVLALLLSLLTIAAITSLQRRSATSREAQLTLGRVEKVLVELQVDPFISLEAFGGDPARARAATRADQREVAARLGKLRRDDPPRELRLLETPLQGYFDALNGLVPVIAAPDFGTKGDPRLFSLLGAAAQNSAAASRLLTEAEREYASRAGRAQRQATVGSAAAILLLLMAFALVFRSSFRARAVAERLAGDNARLAAVNREEALTDALTGLRNRRALIADLEAARPGATLTLALFDLDGFKHYNDTFGHPAGDELLSRLGGRLSEAAPPGATAYRMGGDEFCVLATADDPGLIERAAAALSEDGDAFQIGCSYGSALIPAEASSAQEALGLADQRMYAHKSGRSSASRQTTDVLLKVLSERSADLREHMDGVAALAERTAQRWGLPAHEVKRIGFAAELHDVGKTAIPDTILNKPGALDENEWAFMRRHTVIGERIILAAPSLAPCAELVRSSHEAFDGTGYPDALRGEQIPLGARIIAVSDAFDAIISERPYRAARSVGEAVAELRRCAGTQFDPDVVEAFCAVLDEDDNGAVRQLQAANQ
jgi:diguanylate cyclase (GGDEF)-like protein